MAYQRKTDEELKVIARDLFGGQIFCDRHVKSPEDFRLVFMVAALAGPEWAKSLEDDKITFIYEYLSEAGPRSINGMPSFFSLRMLNQEDMTRMFEYYEKYREFEAHL